MIQTRKAALPRLLTALALAAAAYATPLRAEPDDHPHHEHGPIASSAVVSAKEAGEPGDAAPSAVRYTCPMHPEVVSEKPGRCPHCGMKLVEQQKAPESRTDP